MMMLDIRDRYRGALLGLAVCDALGTTLEFKAPGSFQPLTDLAGGGPFDLAPGQWTDDTSLALCLAESLLECGTFDPVDQLTRYVRWYRHGHLSSTGTCFDIGNTTVDALHRFERTQEPYCGSENPKAAGNGSIMRLAPVPLFFATRPVEAIEKSGDSSRTTHGARTCVDACRYLGALLVGALGGVSKADLLADRYSPVPGYWDTHPLTPEIDAVARGTFHHREPPAIRGTGYVVQSLEAALWAFARSSDFRDGALRAVNLGDDADTTGAVYGQLAGAYYGASGIPQAWLDKLCMRDTITDCADRLSACTHPPTTLYSPHTRLAHNALASSPQQKGPRHAEHRQPAQGRDCPCLPQGSQSRRGACTQSRHETAIRCGRAEAADCDPGEGQQAPARHA